MDIEGAVGTYLSANGLAFICPQYACPYDASTGTGGADLDFLVLDFANRDICVVEVSSAYNLKNLIEKVRARQTRWFIPVTDHLNKVLPKTIDWRAPRFLGFIRRDRVKWAQSQIETSDVHFVGLEDTALSLDWWEKRSTGLPK